MVRTLYDNHNINYTEWFSEFKEWCEMNNIDSNQYDDESPEFFEWIHYELSVEWDDFCDNLKYDKENNVDCVVLGKVGRWNGSFEISPKRFKTLLDAIYACISGCDYIVITEDNGVIHITSTHHDASNYFTIHKLNDLGYECDDDEEDKLFDEKYHTKFNDLQF